MCVTCIDVTVCHILDVTVYLCNTDVFVLQLESDKTALCGEKSALEMEKSGIREELVRVEQEKMDLDTEKMGKPEMSNFVNCC